MCGDFRVGFPHPTPSKINMEPEMMVWKMIFLFNWVIFRFHVNLQGCKPRFRILRYVGFIALFFACEFEIDRQLTR